MRLPDSSEENIKNFTLSEFLVFRIKVPEQREKLFRSGKFFNQSKMIMSKYDSFPYLDVFAGAGGLGEGFSSFQLRSSRCFHAALSVERDSAACQTLMLRHFFCQFPPESVPEEYYRYIQGELSRQELFSLYPDVAEKAAESVLCWTLSDKNRAELNEVVSERIGHQTRWVLLGGPPCQAYSLVGRSRRTNDPEFEHDPRHTLYQQYLHMLEDFAPPVFVMENVQGLLSAKLNNSPVLARIIEDLRTVRHGYRLFSLATADELTPSDDFRKFLINAEDYGVPQARRRIFILGVRSDLDIAPLRLRGRACVTVQEAIDDLPATRSHLSKMRNETEEKWIRAITDLRKISFENMDPGLARHIHACLDKLEQEGFSGGKKAHSARTTFKRWICDKRIREIPQHAARSHMASDLRRYFFAAAFSEFAGRSPKLEDFPAELLPHHKNVAAEPGKSIFSDRFRVQLKDAPSTTITAHIRKDGHYFIHYDPLQCRSLTVREAARLQSFPDNYFFEGNRTEQYLQIGNAVPPLLACRIAEIVYDLLKRMK